MKGIIFDMDGVILNSEPVHIKAEKAMFNDIGITPTKKQLQAMTGNHLLDSLKDLFGLEPRKEYLDRKYRHFKNFIGEIEVFKDAIGFLKKCKKKKGLVTNTVREPAMLMIRRFSLEKYFDFIISSSDVARPKPYPDPYLKAIELMGYPKEEIVVIEDSLSGIESAKRAGLMVIARTGTYPRKELGVADRIIDDFSELKDVI